MKEIKPKHKLAIRWFHWINFPILAIMIWSGTLIYWANDVYHIGPIKFYPQVVYDGLKINGRLAEGMALHFFFMWIFFVNGFLYVLYTIFSGEWRLLVPGRKSLKEAIQVTLYDFHLSKYKPLQGKYNSAQKIAYTAIIIMGIGSLITGLAIYKPVQWSWVTWLCGGYTSARVIHFILTIVYILFFLVHVVQVIIAGWNNFRAMVTGFEVVEVHENGAQESGKE